MNTPTISVSRLSRKKRVSSVSTAPSPSPLRKKNKQIRTSMRSSQRYSLRLSQSKQNH